MLDGNDHGKELHWKFKYSGFISWHKYFKFIITEGLCKSESAHLPNTPSYTYKAVSYYISYQEEGTQAKKLNTGTCESISTI